MANDEFLNAYHFAPVIEGAAEEGDGALPIGSVRRQQPDGQRNRFGFDAATVRDGHAIYASGTFSGRIVCRMTAKTPLVVGAALRPGRDGKDGKSYNVVEPYERGGKPAVPATSLKGLVSSVAEAVSGSALRVLSPRVISYRKDMKDALSAMGRLVRAADNEAWELEPLTPPLIQQVVDYQQRTNPPPQFDVKNPEIWRGIFSGPCSIKTFLGDYRAKPSFDDFLDAILDKDLKTSGDCNAIVYVKRMSQDPSLDHLIRRINREAKDLPNHAGNHFTASRIRIKGIENRNATKLSRYAIEAASSSKVFDKMAMEKDIGAGQSRVADWVAGFVRVLGSTKELGMPSGRKHEVFIPCSPGARRLAIDARVIKKFDDLVAGLPGRDETDASTPGAKRQRLPHIPVNLPDKFSDDWERRAREDFWRPKLREGQIVYFDVDDAGAVSEISFSAIWRDGPFTSDRSGIATVHDFFSKAGERGGATEDLLPMNEARLRVTPAERLFGYVPADRGEEAARHVLSVAGRVRFSDALLPPGAEPAFRYDAATAINPDGSAGRSDRTVPNAVALRELSSPKPPSPSMYFRTDQGHAQVKKNKDSLELGRALPQGRKVYLHFDAKQIAEPWKTCVSVNTDTAPSGGAHRKAVVRPLAADTVLWFHVDFDNLAEEELALLYAGLKPSAAFWHKLGMGKSIGLGSVEIAPVEILLVERRERYASDDPFVAPRYKRVSLQADPLCPEPYAAQIASAPALAGFPLDAVTGAANPWTGARRRFPHAVAGLLEVGEAHAPATPVLPLPVTETRWSNKRKPPEETEGFEWFTIKDRSDYLVPLGPGRSLSDAKLSTSGFGGKPPPPFAARPRRAATGPSSPTVSPRAVSSAASEPDWRDANVTMSGIVKFYKPQDGFGYIKPADGGPDVRLEARVLQVCNMPSPRKDQRVVFQSEDTAKGRYATRVAHPKRSS